MFSNVKIKNILKILTKIFKYQSFYVTDAFTQFRKFDKNKSMSIVNIK